LVIVVGVFREGCKVIWDILLSALRLSVPLIFAAFGGLLSERSGVANIALEGKLLFSAFAGAAVTALTGDVWIGALAGLGASVAVGFLFGAVCIWGRGDQIVIGTAFNLLVFGLIPVCTKALFNVTGSTPALSMEQTFHQPLVFFLLAVVAMLALEVLFRFTRHGLRVSAAGENPEALLTQGVNHNLVRLRAVTEGAVLTGLGGVYLSLCQGSSYIREMSAGRGFIALAALIFGGWRPLPTFAACFFFATADALQMQLQGQKIGEITIPNQFIQILPYVATLFVLVFYAARMKAPAAINRTILPGAQHR
jgi:simple sugar transport system permease protein